MLRIVTNSKFEHLHCFKLPPKKFEIIRWPDILATLCSLYYSSSFSSSSPTCVFWSFQLCILVILSNLQNFNGLMKIQVWSKSKKSSILSKISKIFNSYQNLKNLQFWPNFQKSSFSSKFSKIFLFKQIFKNLQFWQFFKKKLPKFEKSPILAKFSKIFSSTKFLKIFNFDQNLKNLQFWPNFQISLILIKI